MGLKLVSVSYYILVRDKNEKIITPFDEDYRQLRKEGWRRVDSFNVKQKRAIKK